MKNFKKVQIKEVINNEDGYCWVEYVVGNKYGYELVTDEMKNCSVLQTIYNSILNKAITTKPNVKDCKNGYLAKIIGNCMQSENNMWFCEYEDIAEIVGSDEKKQQLFLEKVEKEVENLGLKGYISFNEDDAAITVYGGVITKFLF